MIGIIKLDERKNIIQRLIKILKENKLNDIHKDYVCELVLNTKKTKQQADRFYMYYGLGIYKDKSKTMIEISKHYNCTVPAIRGSIMSVELALYRIPEDAIILVENYLTNQEFPLIQL